MKPVPVVLAWATPGEVVALRTKLDLTQTELAKKLGVSEFTVWRWENSKRRASRSHTIALRRLTQATP